METNNSRHCSDTPKREPPTAKNALTNQRLGKTVTNNSDKMQRHCSDTINRDDQRQQNAATLQCLQQNERDQTHQNAATSQRYCCKETAHTDHQLRRYCCDTAKRGRPTAANATSVQRHITAETNNKNAQRPYSSTAIMLHNMETNSSNRKQHQCTDIAKRGQLTAANAVTLQ